MVWIKGEFLEFLSVVWIKKIFAEAACPSKTDWGKCTKSAILYSVIWSFHSLKYLISPRVINYVNKLVNISFSHCNEVLWETWPSLTICWKTVSFAMSAAYDIANILTSQPCQMVLAHIVAHNHLIINNINLFVECI